MTSNRQRNTPNLLCTGNACADDKNEDTLACSKCNRLVHYLCSRLPAGRAIETERNNQRKREYDKELKTNEHHLLEIVETETQKEELSQLKKKLSDDPALHTVEYVENKLEKKSQPSLKTAADRNEKKEKTIKENENTIKKLKTNKHHLIVETHKEELSQLKKNLSDDPAFHTVEYVENKLEKKLEDFRTEILSTIKEEQKKSYAAAASAGTSAPSNDNIKTAVKQVHEEEAAEEKDKSRRRSITL
ncbi:triadin-like [Clytia hemisphaerica]|uniref:triadin-like n=1 Tax=Clytia hemisphaerica TaxID=252671 RepID=UPI0034D77996